MNINKLVSDRVIQDILLSNGFKLKQQEDGTMTLNSYVIPAVREVINTINLRSHIQNIDIAEEVISSMNVEESFNKLLVDVSYDTSKWLLNDNKELVYIANGDVLTFDDGALELKIRDKSSVHLRFDSWHMMDLYNYHLTNDNIVLTDEFMIQLDQLEKDVLRIFETMIINKVIANA